MSCSKSSGKRNWARGWQINCSRSVCFQQTCAGRKIVVPGGERRVASDSGGGWGDGGERRAIVAADWGTAVRRWLDGMRLHFPSAGDHSAGTGGDRELDFPRWATWG